MPSTRPSPNTLCITASPVWKRWSLTGAGFGGGAAAGVFAFEAGFAAAAAAGTVAGMAALATGLVHFVGAGLIDNAFVRARFAVFTAADFFGAVLARAEALRGDFFCAGLEAGLRAGLRLAAVGRAELLRALALRPDDFLVAVLVPADLRAAETRAVFVAVRPFAAAFAGAFRTVVRLAEA